MSDHETRQQSRRRNAAQILKAAVGFLVITAFTYIAVVAVQHSPPSPDESSVFASEIPTMDPKPLGETADSHAARQQAAVAKRGMSGQKAPAKDFDYVPDHYVNQATKIEEQPPTF